MYTEDGFTLDGAPNVTRILSQKGFLLVPPGDTGRKTSLLAWEVPVERAEELFMEKSKCYKNWYDWFAVQCGMDNTNPAEKDCNGWTAFMHALDAHYSIRACKAAMDYLKCNDFSWGTAHYRSLFDQTTGSQPNGFTALHFACSASNRDFNNHELVRLLIQRKSDLEAREKNGKTALLLAVSAGLLPTVRVLLKAGADIHAQSKKGQGVWEFVPDLNGRQGQGLKELLEEFGAVYTHVSKTWKRKEPKHSSMARVMRSFAMREQTKWYSETWDAWERDGERRDHWTWDNARRGL